MMQNSKEEEKKELIELMEKFKERIDNSEEKVSNFKLT